MAAQSATQTERSEIRWLFNSLQNLFFGMLVLSPSVTTATRQRTIQYWALPLLRSVTGTDLPRVQGESFPGAVSAAAAKDRGHTVGLGVWLQPQLGHNRSFKTLLHPFEIGLIIRTAGTVCYSNQQNVSKWSNEFFFHHILLHCIIHRKCAATELEGLT